MNNLKNMENIKGNSPEKEFPLTKFKLKRKIDVEECEEKPK